MRRKPWLALALVGGLLGAAASALAVPAAIPYTGYLTYATGAPYTGTVSLTVALYDGEQSTNAVWGPFTLGNVSVQSGILSVLLGGPQTGPISDATLGADELWLGFSVNSEAMSGRQRLHAVPYARLAGDAQRLGGVDAADYLAAGDSGDLASLSIGGAIVFDGSGSVIVANDQSACDSSKAGAIRFNGTSFEGCDGTAWGALGGGGGPSGDLGSSSDNAAVSCKAILDSGSSTGTGTYWIDPDATGALAPRQMVCDMDTQGGGWTVIAEVYDESYTMPPPSIGNGSAGTFAQWAAHAWSSNSSYYHPLVYFDLLTTGTTEVLRTNLNSNGLIERQLRYFNFDYNSVTNTAAIGTCQELTGSGMCGSSWNWKWNGGSSPFFDGWGQNTSCNQGGGSTIWNYHNFSQCASDSGLFRYNGSSTARPQLLGSYTTAAFHQSLKVR